MRITDADGGEVKLKPSEENLYLHLIASDSDAHVVVVKLSPSQAKELAKYLENWSR